MSVLKKIFSTPLLLIVIAGLVSLITVFAVINNIEPVEAAPKRNPTPKDYALVRIEGGNTGIIPGDSGLTGFEEWSVASHVSWGTEIPETASTGSARLRGIRQHKPLVIHKAVSLNSPLIFQAFANGENLPAIQIRFYERSKGEDLHKYSINLTNAQIQGFDQEFSDGEMLTETVHVVYERIEVIWEPAGASAVDEITTSS